MKHSNTSHQNMQLIKYNLICFNNAVKNYTILIMLVFEGIHGPFKHLNVNVKKVEKEFISNNECINFPRRNEKCKINLTLDI